MIELIIILGGVITEHAILFMIAGVIAAHDRMVVLSTVAFIFGFVVLLCGVSLI